MPARPSDGISRTPVTKNNGKRYWPKSGIPPKCDKNRCSPRHSWPVEAVRNIHIRGWSQNPYKLTLPANIPHKNFWSMTVYDSQTRSLLQTDYPYSAIGAGTGFPKDGSPNGAVQQNADGTTDIYFGPEAPAGKKSTGYKPIQTGGGSPFCVFTARWKTFLIRPGSLVRSSW